MDVPDKLGGRSVPLERLDDLSQVGLVPVCAKTTQDVKRERISLPVKKQMQRRRAPVVETNTVSLLRLDLVLLRAHPVTSPEAHVVLSWENGATFCYIFVIYKVLTRQ